ncbi:MAG: type I-U CRISPR-associated protein Csb2 [Vulcanimicrobiota bacterium]
MGLTIGVRFLLGRAMATSVGSRLEPEWPPHPDRLFMALTAAHFSEPNDEGRRALEWLECQPAPELIVPEAWERATVTHFVPVNDVQRPRIKDIANVKEAQLKSALALLPDDRPKQARQFPVAVVGDEAVGYRWASDAPAEVREALRELCSRVTYVGHSASLTWVWLDETDAFVGRTLLPTLKNPAIRLRIPRGGRLRLLERAFEGGQRPSIGYWQGYTEADESPEKEVRGTCFRPNLLVLKLDPQNKQRYGLRSTLLLTGVLRNTLLSRYPDPCPAWLSGHHEDGTPVEEDHLAIVPLPFIGHEHADGHLLGLGLALPKRDIPNDELQRLILIIEDDDGILLKMGRLGEARVRAKASMTGERSLQSSTWTARRGARLWASVTPVVLDRHLKSRPSDRERREREIEGLIVRSCQRIGLPSPLVSVSRVSAFRGCPTSPDFPGLPKGRGGQRMMTHARLEFEMPVQGPVLLGAGRYRGYGLFRPLREERTDE